MKVHDIAILKEVSDDLNEGRDFYNRMEKGVGDYFWDSLIADIESLIVYAGIHARSNGLLRMFAKRFPYAIYYEISDGVAYVIAILPMRRDPKWIKNKLLTRR